VNLAVINGPNLNLLGVREPELYGTASLAEVERRVKGKASQIGVTIISWMQSNVEGELVNAVQALRGSADGALVNAGAYTHTSLALRDAFLAVQVPFVEVHLSNIYAREEARQKSLLADVAVGVIAGFGVDSYLLGLDALVGAIGKRRLKAES
jgi:3-dehydroquinate dehydratase-2